MRPYRILIIALLPIGDTLFATPTIRALRRGFPQAHLTAVTYPSNRGILEGNPDIDTLLVQPTRQRPHLSLLGDLWHGLQEAPFDLGIGLNPFLAPAFRLLTKTTRWLDLPLPPWWWLVSHRRPPWSATHAVSSYLRTLEPLGSIIRPDLTPAIALSEEERHWARAALEHQGVRADNFLLALHPGGEGGGGIKRWSAAGFTRVAQALARRYRATVLLVGGKSERPLTEGIAAQLACPVLNLAGETSLKQTAALLEQSDLFIGNDSSPLHIAAAVGTPVVGIYGPSNPEQFAPMTTKAAIVQSHACPPCCNFIGTQALWERPHRRGAPCLKDVTPEQVIAAAVALLNRLDMSRPAAQGG